MQLCSIRLSVTDMMVDKLGLFEAIMYLLFGIRRCRSVVDSDEIVMVGVTNLLK